MVDEGRKKTKKERENVHVVKNDPSPSLSHVRRSDVRCGGAGGSC
jgi:hypothetical protein